MINHGYFVETLSRATLVRLTLTKFLLLAFIVIYLLLPPPPLWAAPPRQTSTTATTMAVVVAQIGFESFAELQWLASHIDVWEVHHAEQLGRGTVIALLPSAMLDDLRLSGYEVTVDNFQSALLQWRPVVSARQNAGIPGFPCYRTVEETYAALAGLTVAHPTLAQWLDIGDSWDKSHEGGTDGYDLQAIVLTNRAIAGPKPVFFLMAAIHAREFVTAEIATRFAEALVNRYGKDAAVTWLLDNHEIHIVAQANPDGRKKAEQVVLWRKNTNSDGCPNENPFFSYYGVDLNRNSSFKWGACEGFDCSSTNTCVDTFRGIAAASEPETQALQNYISTIFADQRGAADSDPAPTDTSGVMISLHSYSQLILFPWGWNDQPSPNHTALETLGRKFGYFTGYEVCQSGEPGCIYQTDGTTDDWAYGELGIAAYTFELGTTFFQQCTYFEESIVEDTLNALTFAAKSAGRPYELPAGPEVIHVSASITDVIPVSATLPLVLGIPAVTDAESSATATLGPILTVSAIADDTRYDSNGWGIEPSQEISAARLTISPVSWITATERFAMNAADGTFDSPVEALQLQLQLTELPVERYYLQLESQDRAGNWGVVTATFVSTRPPTGLLEETEPLPPQRIYLPLVAR